MICVFCIFLSLNYCEFLAHIRWLRLLRIRSYRMMGLKRGRGKSKEYRAEVIKQDMIYLMLTEYTILDRRVWMSHIFFLHTSSVSIIHIFFILNFYCHMLFFTSIILFVFLSLLFLFHGSLLPYLFFMTGGIMLSLI